MAKKIIENDDSKVVGARDIPAEKIGKAPETEKKLKEQTPEQEIPEYADRILKAFSHYPQLYIDTQGGTFTVDTPAVFRSKATLYTNPHHKT